MTAAGPENGIGALQLIEEAVHLLRRAPARHLAAYYVGSLPFTLALLYFWADMSRSAYANRHCAAAALGLSLAFIWMSAIHARVWPGTWPAIPARASSRGTETILSVLCCADTRGGEHI